MKKIYVLILSLFIIVSYSCSKQQAKKIDTVTTDSVKYSYTKLNVKELYPKFEQKSIESIDLTKREDIASSLYYKKDKFLEKTVYVKSSPYEVIKNFKENINKLSNEDKIKYLELSLQLGKTEEMKTILSLLKNNKKAVYISNLLYKFDKTKIALEYLYKNLEYLLNKKFEKEDNFSVLYFQIVSNINFIEKITLRKNDNLEVFYKDALNKYPNSKKIISKYVSYLFSNNKNEKLEKLLNSYLSNKDFKIYSINKLATLFLKNKNYEKLERLYNKNIKFPENRELFNSYVQSLKNRKIWANYFKKIIREYNKSKNIDDFYRYYFSLLYNNKATKSLLMNHFNYLLKNGDKKDILILTKILNEKGHYDKAFILLNKGLLKFQNDPIFEEYLIISLDILKNKNYTNEEYSSYYLFNTPDFVGGILSLIQNLYNDTSFLSAISLQQASQDRDEDINYLYSKYKNSFKNPKNRVKFVKNYFYYLKTSGDYDKLRKLASILINSTKDNFLKLELYKILLNISRNKGFEVAKIEELYEIILKNNKNNENFSKYLNEAINFIKNRHNTPFVIGVLHSYLKKYPKNEILYDQLINLYDYKRFYTKEFDIYKLALKEFKTNSWSDKFSRFLIRKKMYSELEKFNKELLKTKEMNEYVTQLIKILPRRSYYSKYNKFYKQHNELFKKLYLNALDKYPFNRNILEKLLYFYTSTAYRNPNKAANLEEYKNLVYKYMFIYPDLRRKITNEELDKKLVQLSEKTKKTVPETIFIAQTHKMRSRFEKALKEYRVLSKYYITDELILNDTANLLKSLASSFYIENPNFLKEAELYFKRLTFLDRMNKNYYISLAELYYELNKTEDATSTLFRALEYQKNNQSIYEAIANVFYDYYDYDNALKTFNLFRTRVEKKNIANVFVGRLYELKGDYDKALDEYVIDIVENPTSSYESKKRVKALYNKKGIKEKFLSKLSKYEDKIIKNHDLFNNVIVMYSMIDNKKEKNALYLLALKKSENIDILENIYNNFSDNKELAEKTLLTLEKYKKDDDIYEKEIAFYQKYKDFNNIKSSFEKLLSINLVDNDEEKFISIKNRYINLLKEYKKYTEAISQRESLTKYYDKYNKVENKLKIAKIYLLKDKEEYKKYILELDKDFPDNENVARTIFELYRKENNIKQLSSYLTELIKRTKKSKNLSYDEKKYRIKNYRNSLIIELTKLKRYTEVQDQQIEILNRNPLDFYEAEKIYKYAKKYNLEKRLLLYYEKVSKKSFKNYKYMMLNAHLREYNRENREALTYYQNAFKVEPQMYEYIGDNIARLYIELKEYKKAYDIYKISYSKISGFYSKEKYLIKMFTTSLLMKDEIVVNSLAQKLAGDPNNLYDKKSNSNIKIVIENLYLYNYLDLAKKYAEKYLNIDLKKSYVDSNVLYLYYKISLEKKETIKFLEYVINSFNTIKYKNSRSYSLNTLANAISRFIPENSQYYTESEYTKITNYVEQNSNNKKLKYALSNFYLNSLLYNKYFETLRHKYQQINFLKKRALYKNILNNGYLNSRSKYDYLRSLKKIALYQNAWGYQQTSVGTLKTIFENKCNGYGLNLYPDYLYKSEKSSYRALVNNRCQYKTIKASFIKYKEKSSALKLIDNQDKSKIWKLREKISVYNGLNDYSEDGIKLYNTLLKQDTTVSEQLMNKGYNKQLNMNQWNAYLKEYSKYLLKMNKNVEKYLLNIIEINPSSQKSYRMIASIYKESKDYKNALKYLKYANKIKENSNISLDMMEIYFLQKDNVNYNRIKTKLLNKNQIMLFSKIYHKLVLLKALDDNFIAKYEMKLLEECENYDYDKLHTFIEHVINYHITNKNFDKIDIFRKRFKKPFFNTEILYSLLINNDISNKRKLAYLKEYSYSRDYDIVKWRRIFIKFNAQIGNPKGALVAFNKNKNMLVEDMDSSELYLLEFKVNYWNKNLEYLLENIQNYKKKLDYPYGYLQELISFIDSQKDSDFKKELYKKIYPIVKSSSDINSNYKVKILSAFTKDELRDELTILLSEDNINNLKSYQKLAIKNDLIDIYRDFLEKELSTYHKFNKKIKNSDDDYQNYILALIQANKPQQLSKILKYRKLSLKEINKLSNTINKMDTKEIKLINLNILVDLEDLLCIKAMLLNKMKQYEKLSPIIEKLTHFKYKEVKLRFTAFINNSKNIYDKNSLKMVKDALYYNPNNKSLKTILLKHYIKLSMDKKAFFMFGETGFTYKVFGNLVDSYLDYNSFASINSYYNDYGYGYGEESTLNQIVTTKEKKSNYTAVKTLLTNYDKSAEKIITDFLYKQYKREFKSNKKLGLQILSYLSETDNKYKIEFKELEEKE